MYLTLHQTFITLLLFFQSKQTWLCIQINPMSFSSQYCLVLFYCTSAYNKNQQHEWIKKGLLIFESELIQKRKMFFPPSFLKDAEYIRFSSSYLWLIQFIIPFPLFQGCKGTPYTASVHLKSQEGWVGKCWGIWKIRWEGNCNLRSRQS